MSEGAERALLALAALRKGNREGCFSSSQGGMDIQDGGGAGGGGRDRGSKSPSRTGSHFERTLTQRERNVYQPSRILTERERRSASPPRNSVMGASVRGNDIVHVQPLIVLSQEGLDRSTPSRIISPRAASSPTDPFYSRQQILAMAKDRGRGRERERERETQSGSLQFLRESKGLGGHGREGGAEMAKGGVHLSPVAALQLSPKSESFQVHLPKRTP